MQKYLKLVFPARVTMCQEAFMLGSWREGNTENKRKGREVGGDRSSYSAQPGVAELGGPCPRAVASP